MAYRAHFVIADRLALNVLVGTRFLKGRLKTIDFEHDFLIFKRVAVVPVRSSMTKNGDKTPCTTQSATCTALSRAQRRDTITGGYETHAVRTTK